MVEGVRDGIEVRGIDAISLAPGQGLNESIRVICNT